MNFLTSLNEPLIRISVNVPEQRVNHIRDFLLLTILGMNVSHGDKPFLPHRHLQHSASIFTIVIAQQRHIG